MKKTFTLVASLCSLMAAKAQLTPGNLVIYRVGDGSAALTAKATPVFLDEHLVTPATLFTKSSPKVQSIALPATSGSAPAGNFLLTAYGNGSTEGFITRSVDGNYLVFSGYNSGSDTSTAKVANLLNTTARVIGTIDQAGKINTSTAIPGVPYATNKTGYAPRTVLSKDGKSFIFNSSTTGIYSANLGDTSAKVVSAYNKTKHPQGSPTSRELGVYNGTIYSSYQSTYIAPGNTTTSSVSFASLGSIDAPDTAITPLPGIDTVYASATTTKSSPYQFVILKLNGGDVLYIADDATNGAIIERGIQKYSLVSGTWVYNGSIYAAGVRGLTGVNSGDTVALFATSTRKLFGALDLTGWNVHVSSDSASILDTSATNTQFRGIAFAPGIPVLAVTLKASLTASVINNSAVLSWATATETNNKNFVIEKSLDGKSFAAIKTLLANNKPSSYTFTDPSKLNAVQYYRLKMTNNDGSYTYSGVATVTNKVTIHIGVSPNPVISNATISHGLATSGATLKITTITGKTVATYPVQVGATQTSVDVAHLTSGSYIVSYVNGGSTTTTQFVK